jgi:uncharacterized protein (DUF2062 family)
VQKGFFYERLVWPILRLLRQGVTPEMMALSLALGGALGVFPALGCTTLLCTIVAIVLRLNLPAIQIVNYFVYPIQIALLLPFFRLGEKLFRAAPLPVSMAQIQGMIHANPWAAVRFLWTTTWHAIVAWGLIAPVFVGLAYLILTPVLRRVLHREVTPTAETD